MHHATYLGRFKVAGLGFAALAAWSCGGTTPSGSNDAGASNRGNVSSGGAGSGAGGTAGAAALGAAGTSGVSGASMGISGGGAGGASAGSGQSMAGGPAGAGGLMSAGGASAASGGQAGTISTSGGQGGMSVGGEAGVSAGSAAGGAPSAGGGGQAAGAAGMAGASTTVVKKFIGNISSKNQDIQPDFADLWTQVTMEANSKWGFVQPNSASDWVWEPVDAVYKYANDHNMVFKGHCFFWNFEQPSWVTDSNVMTVGPAWVKAFCERYPKTAVIDVVNEPGHNPAPYRNGMGGAGVSGFDWVLQGFKWAKEFCPNAELVLNDFNIIEYDNDNASFITMLQKLLDAGAPIDAIGAQGHDVYKVGAAKSKTYIDKLASTFNLPIYITEMDIDQSNDDQQSQLMQDEITMFWNHPSVKGITYWGYVKGTTWRTNAWLMDSNGKNRPAMTWLQTFIQANAK